MPKNGASFKEEQQFEFLLTNITLKHQFNSHQKKKE